MTVSVVWAVNATIRGTDVVWRREARWHPEICCPWHGIQRACGTSTLFCCLDGHWKALRCLRLDVLLLHERKSHPLNSSCCSITLTKLLFCESKLERIHLPCWICLCKLMDLFDFEVPDNQRSCVSSFVPSRRSLCYVCEVPKSWDETSWFRVAPVEAACIRGQVQTVGRPCSLES